MLDEALLESFMNGFYGYGTWSAKYWFVGMEEGGGSSIAEVAARLETWNHRGRPEVDDLFEFCKSTGIKQWFGPNAKRQATWAQLCRVALIANAQSVERENIIEYQNTRLARREGETALLELLPLPSTKTTAWIYSGVTSLPFLNSRRGYEEFIRPGRLRQLRENIAIHRPRAVVFYGNRYFWKNELVLKSGEYFDTNTSGSTLLIATAHPTAWGKANDRFAAIGHLIRKHVEGRS